MVCECNYLYHIQPPTIFLMHSDSTQKIDITELETDDCWYMVVDSISCDDLPFINILMNICVRNHYDNFSVMGKNLDSRVVEHLCNLSMNLFVSNEPKIVFSIDIALQHILGDNAYVGTYVKNENIVFSQPINAGSLKYIDFAKVFPYAEHIVEEISALKLTTVEKILWIDNWVQANIQYIKNYKTTATDGSRYVCDNIKEESTMPDVLINHYGVCEDIATSIAIILKKLHIVCEEVQANGHAWLLVELDGQTFLWDCTRNITRNEHLAPNGIKATSYSYQHTLRGEEFCKNKYDDIPNMPKIAFFDYPRYKVNEIIQELKLKNVSLAYESVAPYNSFIELR